MAGRIAAASGEFKREGPLCYHRVALLALLLLLALVPAGCAAIGGGKPPAPQPPAAHGAPAADPRAVAVAEAAAGQALIARGETAAAVPHLREAVRLQGDLLEARASLGRALYGAGDFDGALGEFRAVLRVDPDAASARVGLATVLMARQDWAGARTELEQLVRRHGDHLQAHYSLGLVRYTLGDLAGAIEAYRRVVELEPTHGDARYHLALALKLAHRDAEATAEFLAAARHGVPRAQYFIGTAYAAGTAVDRDLAAAIAWWFSAADGGVTEAGDALARLRQAATGRGRHPQAEREAAARAFGDYRGGLWRQFPDLTRGEHESVGAALLAQARVREAVSVLIREASALSEPAQRALETLYEQGVDGHLPAHDPRILAYLTTAAAEGETRPRIELARIYARGLGVPKDVRRAVALLKATPHEDARRLLQELSAAGDEPR